MSTQKHKINQSVYRFQQRVKIIVERLTTVQICDYEIVIDWSFDDLLML